jgi:hypothetical protein
MHSKEYEQQLKAVHSQRPANKPWGTTGARNFGEYVRKYIDDHNGWIKSVLDFGAGQQSLGRYIAEHSEYAKRKGLVWTDFDPGIAGIDDPSVLEGRYDLVISSDVLEHVEPEQVAGTLEQLRRCARRAQYHHIACEPCGLILPDGRNAHLSVHSPEQWREWLEVDGWKVQYWCNELERKRGELRRACKILLEK